MSINPRRKKYHKTKFIIYILLLGALGTVVFLLNSYYLSKKPLFISPMGIQNNVVSVIEKKLKEKNISYSQVVGLADSTYLVSISNSGQIRFSSNKDIELQVSSLQRILNQLTIEGKSFKIIDFRFLEPMISF